MPQQSAVQKALEVFSPPHKIPEELLKNRKFLDSTKDGQEVQEGEGHGEDSPKASKTLTEE